MELVGLKVWTAWIGIGVHVWPSRRSPYLMKCFCLNNDLDKHKRILILGPQSKSIFLLTASIQFCGVEGCLDDKSKTV